MDHALNAMVVHDMKNALALLEADLEQLNRHPDLPPEASKAYRRCIELKNRLIGFLTLYRSEEKGLHPVLRDCPVLDFLEAFLDGALWANEGIQALVARERMARDAENRMAYFDEDLVEIALESALNNASRYARKKVEIWFEQDASGIAFFVLDDGPGLSPEKSPSTGLGLALCDAVAKAHQHDGRHGTARLSNSAEGGALFEMRLP